MAAPQSDIEADPDQRRELFQMKVDGEDCYVPLRRAGELYDEGWHNVQIGGLVLTLPEGVTREITKQERGDIVRIADEWSEMQ